MALRFLFDQYVFAWNTKDFKLHKGRDNNHAHYYNLSPKFLIQRMSQIYRISKAGVSFTMMKVIGWNGLKILVSVDKKASIFLFLINVFSVLQCVVIGLQSTGEARTLEALEEGGGELNDFVSTAK